MIDAKRGDLVELNGLPCVIVGLAGEYFGEEEVPEEHVAVWYGDIKPKPTWEGGLGNVQTEVYTVPIDCLEPGQVPTVRH
jgi:hypothetical protein